MAISEGTFGYRGVDSDMQHTVNSSRTPQNLYQTLQKVEDHVFVYRYDEIFSRRQLMMNHGQLNETNTLKSMVSYSIKKRLRVREIPDILSLN